MQVAIADFIKSPALYLEKVDSESVSIIKDGYTVAILVKPSSTPVTDSLIGILKDSGIKNTKDIKAMRTVFADTNVILEDALQAWCATKAKADALITRDTGGFPGINIFVVSPADFVI